MADHNNQKNVNYAENAEHEEPSIWEPINVIKSVISTALLIFSTACIFGLIFTEQTSVAEKVHPAMALVCLVVCSTWLTMIEGSQASIVGLAPVNRELYRESHPHAYKCSVIAHEGDNLDRYLLGRQFMVVLVVFIINNAAHALSTAELWGFPQWFMDVFIHLGLYMIFFTVMYGQLSSEVNASLCMLDYLNNWFGVFTVYVALGLEFSGILHSAYLIRIMFCAAAGKTLTSNEPPRTEFQNLFYWGRVAFSCAALIFSFVVTLVALFEGKTTMWEGVPPGAAVVLFFGLMAVVGLLEATQIAYFAVSKLKKEERGQTIWAKKTCDDLFAGKDGLPGVNLPGYMIGRQLCVVSCMFFVARVTSTNVKPGEPTILGVSEGMQKFFNTGLLGALITTIVGSIAWRLAASTFPIFFMNILPSWIFLKICLALEASGLLNGAWVLGWIHKRVAGFQIDEVYIGTPEERAARQMGDNEENLKIGPGHMIILPGFAEQAPESLMKLLKEDKAVAQFFHSINERLSATGSNHGAVENFDKTHLETDSEVDV